jgi:hypothetical protein
LNRARVEQVVLAALPHPAADDEQNGDLFAAIASFLIVCVELARFGSRPGPIA